MLNKKRWKHLDHLGDRAKPVIPVGVGAKWNRTEVQLGGVPAIHSLFQPASSFSAADEKPSLQKNSLLFNIKQLIDYLSLTLDRIYLDTFLYII